MCDTKQGACISEDGKVSGACVGVRMCVYAWALVCTCACACVGNGCKGHTRRWQPCWSLL